MLGKQKKIQTKNKELVKKKQRLFRRTRFILTTRTATSTLILGDGGC
jgi:hypothetical protein